MNTLNVGVRIAKLNAKLNAKELMGPGRRVTGKI